MFRFFKKKEKDLSMPTDKKTPLSEEERGNILEKIETEKAHLNSASSQDNDSAIYEKIGLLYAELSDDENAIKFLEESLKEKLSIGDGYKKLMSLYNKKRAEAAKDKDNDAIDYYMSKMDEMRNIAKKVTLSR